jgi:hypothetical protein
VSERASVGRPGGSWRDPGRRSYGSVVIATGAHDLLTFGEDDGDVIPLRDATKVWFAISPPTFGLCALLGLVATTVT